MIRSFILVVVGCLCTPSVSAQTRPGVDVSEHRARYQTITRELPTYRQASTDGETVGLERQSTEGSAIDVHCKGDSIRVAVVTHSGEYGRSVHRYYWWRHEVFFAHFTHERRDRLYGPTVGSTEERLYFRDGELIRWLGAGNVAQSLRTSDARKRWQSAGLESETVFSKLFSCRLP